jgi:hypothetical protein
VIGLKGSRGVAPLTLRDVTGLIIPNERAFLAAFIGYGWWDNYAYAAMVTQPRKVLKGVPVTRGLWERITDAMQEVGMIEKKRGEPATVHFYPERRYEHIVELNEKGAAAAPPVATSPLVSASQALP